MICAWSVYSILSHNHNLFLHVEILQQPQSVTVSDGEFAKFTCGAHAKYINWRINGRAFLPSDGYINKSTTVQNKTMNIRLSALCIRGMTVNNGSSISCLASIDDIAHQSDNAILYVQGIIMCCMHGISVY